MQAFSTKIGTFDNFLTSKYLPAAIPVEQQGVFDHEAESAECFRSYLFIITSVRVSMTVFYEEPCAISPAIFKLPWPMARRMAGHTYGGGSERLSALLGAIADFCAFAVSCTRY